MYIANECIYTTLIDTTSVRACLCVTCTYNKNYRSAYTEVLTLKSNDLALYLCLSIHSLPPVLPLSWSWKRMASPYFLIQKVDLFFSFTYVDSHLSNA